MEGDSSIVIFRSYDRIQNSQWEVTMRKRTVGNYALHSTARFFLLEIKIWWISYAKIASVVLKTDSTKELQLLNESWGWNHIFKRKSENTIFKQLFRNIQKYQKNPSPQKSLMSSSPSRVPCSCACFLSRILLHLNSCSLGGSKLLFSVT